MRKAHKILEDTVTSWNMIFFSLDLYSFRNYFYWNKKKKNTESATEIFWIGKFHFEWYQKGFSERSIWQPLPDWRSTQSFSVLFCIQEDSNPPNRIRSLNLFTQANKPSNRGSPVESWVISHIIPSKSCKRNFWFVCTKHAEVYYDLQKVSLQTSISMKIGRCECKPLAEKNI